MRDDIEGIRAALAEGADVHARVSLPAKTPTLSAIGWARAPAIVDVLLAAGADINTTDAEGATPLQRAVSNARYLPGLAAFLLSRGGDPNSRLPARFYTPLDLALENGDLVFARKLLEAGARITSDTLRRLGRDPEKVVLLEEWPIRSSTVADREKQLFLAARTGDLEAVRSLLRDGANATERVSGESAVDHAWRKGHPDVALVIEQTAVLHHEHAALFVAALDDSPDQIEIAAASIALEARNAEGFTALMLAARYGRHEAIRALLSLGATIDQRNSGSTALVYAIQSGHLEGMQLLLDGGASINFDVDGHNPVLDAACAQVDSDLLKQLLLRALDVSPYPSQWASGDNDRLLRNAKAGLPPLAGPTVSSWSECTICRDLPDQMGWCLTARGERTGEYFPTITERFETFRDLWKCPLCGTYYEYQRDHDNGIPDGWDSEDLDRISLERALAVLQRMDSNRRIEREIAKLTERLQLEACRR